MSDPRRWDKYDGTVPRPLSPSRLRWIIGRRAIVVVAITGSLIVALANAIQASARFGWVFFFVALITWLVLVPTTVWLSILQIKGRAGTVRDADGGGAS